MLYVQYKNRRALLILGFVGMALFAIGDVLLRSFPQEGAEMLVMLRSSVGQMPLWRLYFTLLTGVIAAPMAWCGLCALDSLLRDRLGVCRGMYACYRAGAIVGGLSFFAAHSVCAVLMLAVRQALACGLTPEVVDAAYRTPFLLSFAVTNLWVTVTELLLSVASAYFIFKRVINAPRWMALMNTAGAYIVFHVVGGLMERVTANGLFGLLANAGASLGMGLMFLAAATARD